MLVFRSVVVQPVDLFLGDRSVVDNGEWLPRHHMMASGFYFLFCKLMSSPLMLGIFSIKLWLWASKDAKARRICIHF